MEMEIERERERDMNRGRDKERILEKRTVSGIHKANVGRWFNGVNIWVQPGET